MTTTPAIATPGHAVVANSAQRVYDNYWSAADGWKPTDTLDEDLRSWLIGLAAPGDSVLDIGCGDGSRYAEFLIQSGADLHGIDVSEVAVAAAAAKGIKARRAGLDQAMPFADGTFAAAVCLEVLEHLFDPEFAVREIRRVLKPGGRALLSVPNVAHWRRRLELLFLGRLDPGGSPRTSRTHPWRDPHVRFFNQQNLADLLSQAGLTVERVGGLDLQFLNAAPGLRRLTQIRSLTFINRSCRKLATAWPALLAGRCVALARKTR